MPIDFTCRGCGTHYHAKDELAGRSIRCRACGTIVPIPESLEVIEEFDEVDESGEPSPSKPMRFARVNPPSSPRQRIQSFDRPSSGSNAWAIAFGIGLALVAVVGLGMVLVIAASRFKRQANVVNQKWPPPNRRFNPKDPIRPNQNAVPPEFPERGPAVALEPGVEFHEIMLKPRPGQTAGPGQSGKLWLYLPAGKHADKSLPCVLIAPAGSNLLTGMNLENGDRAEHIPYVRAGFAVLAFELDGGVPRNFNNAAYLSGYLKFLAAGGGLINSRNAFQYLLKRVPEVDPKRVFAAGHSSAGSFAVLFAEHEPRLIGCAAFAPALDYEAHFAKNIVPLRRTFVVVDAFIERFSPRNHERTLACPLFLFGAEDDQVTPIADTREAYERFKGLKKDVRLDVVPAGNHYVSMIREGIPRAIGWMKERLAEQGFPEPTPPDGAWPVGAPVGTME